MAALEYDHLDVFEWLVSKGARKIKIKIIWGEVFFILQLVENSIDVIKWLISKGANVNERQDSLLLGWSPIMAASSGGRRDVVELLLSYGADANDSDHMTSALQIASKGNNVDVVELLLSKGANLHFKGRFDETP